MPITQYQVRRRQSPGYVSDGHLYRVPAYSAKEAAETFRTNIMMDSHPYDVEVIEPNGTVLVYHTQSMFVAVEVLGASGVQQARTFGSVG